MRKNKKWEGEPVLGNWYLRLSTPTQNKSWIMFTVGLKNMGDMGTYVYV